MPAKRKKTGNKPIFEQHNTTTTMKKTLNDTELDELETIFDRFTEQQHACLSENQRNESLKDFLQTYRDNDTWATVAEYETAVLENGAWVFKCDTSEPANPEPRARAMEQGKPSNGFGYIFKTTFAQDFTIADAFGTNAVQDTFNRAFEEWRRDAIYLTELVLILNWKIWEHHEKSQTATGAEKAKHEALANLYNDIWHKADEYALDNLKGSEFSYFYSVTD